MGTMMPAAVTGWHLLNHQLQLKQQTHTCRSSTYFSALPPKNYYTCRKGSHLKPLSSHSAKAQWYLCIRTAAVQCCFFADLAVEVSMFRFRAWGHILILILDLQLESSKETKTRAATAQAHSVVTVLRQLCKLPHGATISRTRENNPDFCEHLYSPPF